MKAEPSVNDGRINGTASGNIEGDEVTSWPNHRRGYVQVDTIQSTDKYEVMLLRSTKTLG